jgi:hypothetical protein
MGEGVIVLGFDAAHLLYQTLEESLYGVGTMDEASILVGLSVAFRLMILRAIHMLCQQVVVQVE